MLSVYCVVTASDGRKKSEIGVSTNWCIAIKHQRLSSIRVIFIDYQTSKLQYNYLSDMQSLDSSFFYLISFLLLFLIYFG